jgi:hypothetical protein
MGGGSQGIHKGAPVLTFNNYRGIHEIAVMADKKKETPNSADAAIEQEILLERKFNLAEAIGRLGGSGLLKGDSPIPGKKQAEYEIEQYLEKHLIDSAGALETVLLRHVRSSDLFLHGGFDQPLLALRQVLTQLLETDQLLRDFVAEVDREWGRMYRERPHLEVVDQPPHPDDPYTVSSVTATLSGLMRTLPSG